MNEQLPQGAQNDQESTIQSGVEKELTAETILDDFHAAWKDKAEWIAEAEEDLAFVYGKQWDDKDVAELHEAGVRALTINKIKPKINLITGIESQNRSDFVAYPVGKEDEVKADISTALLKNIMKTSGGDYKISEQFELAVDVGEGFIEPYIDYTNDIINGEMKHKIINPAHLFLEPGSTEYDMSDAKYIVKMTPDLTKDELLTLFPAASDVLETVAGGQIDFESWKTTDRAGFNASNINYRASTSNTSDPEKGTKEPLFDLVEYYYKKFVKRTYVVDTVLKTLKVAKDEPTAQMYVDTANTETPGSAKKFARFEPVIWKAAVVGKEKIDDQQCWSYPEWKTYPIFSLYAYKCPIKLKDSKLNVQGIPRQLKDLNREFNKRRTQELRILNSSANSGWQAEEGTVTPEQKKVYKKYGASAGVFLEHKVGKLAPQRMLPTPLSQGHSQLAAETNQDIKESSGMNDDMMAMNEGQSSGRAIMLRQKQGMVMVQKIFDNLSQTKRNIGKFHLSQMGKVFDVESAMRVLGEKFCMETFQKPVMVPVMQPVVHPTTGPMVDTRTGQPAVQPVVDPQSGQPAMQPQMNPQTGQPVTEFDQQACITMFNDVLKDTQMGKYDVSVGEGAQSETVKFANYMTLRDLASAGIQIPPDIIVDESTLSAASKERIKTSIEQQQQAMAQAQAQAHAAPPPMKR